MNVKQFRAQSFLNSRKSEFAISIIPWFETTVPQEIWDIFYLAALHAMCFLSLFVIFYSVKRQPLYRVLP